MVNQRAPKLYQYGNIVLSQFQTKSRFFVIFFEDLILFKKLFLNGSARQLGENLVDFSEKLS